MVTTVSQAGMSADRLPNRRRPRRRTMTADRLVRLALAAVLLTLPDSASALEIFVGVGSNAAGIQGTVASFRSALGDPNNLNTAGPLPSGRREINWDGGGAVDGSPAGTPFAGFQNRGVIFETPGSGFLQGPVGPTAASSELSDVFGTNYSGTFASFSPVRLFVPQGSNVTEANFSIPGSNGTVPATVAGFGAVFSDVDTGATTIEFFDASNNLITTLTVPGVTGNQTFSFGGILLDPSEPGIASLRITTGNAALGVADGGGVDVVAMDDFLFAEPLAVPEPATLVLVGSGLALGALAWRRRQ
jgi:PEP-CTERM motif